jgi:hypothetical protein
MNFWLSSHAWACGRNETLKKRRRPDGYDRNNLSCKKKLWICTSCPLNCIKLEQWSKNETI